MRQLGLIMGGAVMVAIAGCMPAHAPAPTPAPPSAAPETTVRPLASPEGLDADMGTLQPGVLSHVMRAYYADVEKVFRANGLMRTDIAPRDATFTRDQLVADFMQIALYDEYATENGNFIARLTPSRLRRWQDPVRMSLEFGASVPEAQRRVDRSAIRAYAGHLGHVSNHPVTLSENGGNFTIFVVDEDERRALAPRLKTLIPGIDHTTLRAITDLSPSNFCVVFAFSAPMRHDYSNAVAVIRAELPPALRASCIQEELAQGMGLANDSPEARPSIFNDSEEFSRLTRHDELLLRILYDPRLTPGMTEAEARPIVETIATEVMGKGD